MAEKEDKTTNELLKEVLTELKAINDRNKKVDEEEARKNRRLEINDAEFVFLLLGVGLGFFAQVLYDYYGTFYPNIPLWKTAVGVVIIFSLMGFVYMYIRNHNKKMELKKAKNEGEKTA